MAKDKVMSASELASRRRQIAGLLYSGVKPADVAKQTGAPRQLVDEEHRLVAERMEQHDIAPDQKVFSVSQVAGLIGFWTRNVRNAIEQGHLAAERVGRTWMLRRKDVLPYITELRMRGRPIKKRRTRKKRT